MFVSRCTCVAWARPYSVTSASVTRCCTYSAATIAVVTNDGRNIVGVLRGYDQATNMILDECHERVYSMQARGSGLAESVQWPRQPVSC